MRSLRSELQSPASKLIKHNASRLFLSNWIPGRIHAHACTIVFLDTFLDISFREYLFLELFLKNLLNVGFSSNYFYIIYFPIDLIFQIAFAHL